MSNKFQITNPVWDKVYDAYAWRDNNRTLALVQGEGITIPDGTGINATVTAFRAKAPRFQLKDDRGVIDLSSGDPELSWAIQRPDGSEDIVVCNIVTAASGIIEIPITASATRYAGDVYGEIRLITSNGTTKFYGIGAKVGQGVSDDAAAQATQYSALIAALQKVVSLQTGSVAAMDDLTSGGDLRNGTNPVASGNLKIYLEGNYLNYLGNRFVKMRIAYPDSCTDEQMSGITDGVRMRDSVASDTLYIVRGGTAITNGDFNGAMICAKYRSNSGQQTQYWLTRSGVFQYRTKAADTEDWPTTWIKFETAANKDTASLSNSDDKYPSSKLVKTQLDTKESISNKDTAFLNESNHTTYPSSKLVGAKLAEKVDKTTTIAGIDLSDDISADDILSALMNTGNTIYYHSDSVSPFGTQKYLDIPVPAIWRSNNNVFLVLSKTAGAPSPTYGIPYTYDGLQLTRFHAVSSWDVFNPDTTSGTQGEILVGSMSNGVWICNGGTNWIRLAQLSDLNNIRTKRAAVTLSSSLWSSGTQEIDVSGVYTLTNNTKVDIDIDSDTFVTLQSVGCHGIYIETLVVSNTTTLIAKAMGATPITDIDIQLIFSETTDLGTISGGDGE